MGVLVTYRPDNAMPRVVPELLRQSARLVPDRTAVALDGTAELTFAECEARSNAFARGLREKRDVRHGDLVGLLFSNADWLDFIVAYFGTVKLGAVAVLLSDRFTHDEIRRLIDRHRMVGVVAAGTHPVPTGDWWVESSARIEKDHPGDDFPIACGPSDVAEVIFTSGTTATPKGVAATHANIVRAKQTWPTRPRPVQQWLHGLPVGSVAAQILLVNSIGTQQTLVLLSDFDVARFHRLAQRYAVTFVCLVPAMGHRLAVEAPAYGALASVRGVTFSSAMLPAEVVPALAATFPRAAFYNLYTSTEAFPARVSTEVDSGRPGSVGRPARTAVRVSDDDGLDAPAGTTGQVWLRASGAPARRYLDDAEATRATFDDGWTRTGDLGYVDADGYLYLVGRVDDTINVGGFNVSAFKVEEALCRHEAVAEAAVFAATHATLGQVVAAAVVLRGETTVREIRQHARGHLYRREIPVIIRIAAELPRNAAGKVVKRELPALLDAPGGLAFSAPRSPLERGLAEIWADVLDVGAVGVHDNFFEIGGDSLTAMEIAARVRATLGVEMDVTSVFERPTIADQVDELNVAERDNIAGRENRGDGGASDGEPGQDREVAKRPS
jgi:long-chain acyl-CoA synthetase